TPRPKVANQLRSCLPGLMSRATAPTTRPNTRKPITSQIMESHVPPAAGSTHPTWSVVGRTPVDGGAPVGRDVVATGRLVLDGVAVDARGLGGRGPAELAHQA